LPFLGNGLRRRNCELSAGRYPLLVMGIIRAMAAAGIESAWSRWNAG